MKQTKKQKNNRTKHKKYNRHKKHNNKGGTHINKESTHIKSSHNQTKKFIKLKCSPKPVGQKRESTTCYEYDDLLKLKNTWNKKNPTNQIVTTDKDEIWKELKNKLSNICDKESCWYKQIVTSYDDNHKFKELFAPKSPDEWKKNPNQWLSSSDIINVMKQYEKIYKCFEFIGPSPVDYDFIEYPGECVWNELCNFKLSEQIKKGKTKIGIIFNTDTHDKGGSHWISLFINIKKGFIFYFDSAGNPINKYVNKFVKTVTKQGDELSPPIKFKFDQNYPREHQYGTTECGMYSLYFIIQMLEDKLTGEYLKTHVISDEYIEKFRQIYYNQDL